jgi:hypothetical protein
MAMTSLARVRDDGLREYNYDIMQTAGGTQVLDDCPTSWLWERWAMYGITHLFRG